MNPRTIKRIVVATDFSELSGEAIETAIGLAQEFGATLDLVHVAPDLAMALPPPMDVITLPLDPAARLEEASRRISGEEQRIRGQGVACESTVLAGRSDTEIVAHAEKTHADLIVIGTHGRGPIGHALLGSVAEKVVQHAHCPVLTVPQRRAPHA
jgi:nucleotide-binding universal stress UspA family protein